jgi:hypothetical protein
MAFIFGHQRRHVYSCDSIKRNHPSRKDLSIGAIEVGQVLSISNTAGTLPNSRQRFQGTIVRLFSTLGTTKFSYSLLRVPYYDHFAGIDTAIQASTSQSLRSRFLPSASIPVTLDYNQTPVAGVQIDVALLNVLYSGAFNTRAASFHFSFNITNTYQNYT